MLIQKSESFDHRYALDFVHPLKRIVVACLMHHHFIVTGFSVCNCIPPNDEGYYIGYYYIGLSLTNQSPVPPLLFACHRHLFSLPLSYNFLYRSIFVIKSSIILDLDRETLLVNGHWGRRLIWAIWPTLWLFHQGGNSCQNFGSGERDVIKRQDVYWEGWWYCIDTGYFKSVLFIRELILMQSCALQTLPLPFETN